MGLVRYDEVRKIVIYSVCATCGIALGEKLAEGYYGVKDKVSEIYHGARGGEVKKP
ncbi:hypothetical protein RHGRI_003205 [Rhododendron griersonianum]|uniref:DNA-directed RNA polymerase n=1 Tax=Rhododendron griersonianum TaxID=479676 RepID=A0AAV6L4W1_9ERIC|nr:hypothetical protein RHGRI_003205 [Rhododendron griersonianum]